MSTSDGEPFLAAFESRLRRAPDARRRQAFATELHDFEIRTDSPALHDELRAFLAPSLEPARHRGGWRLIALASSSADLWAFARGAAPASIAIHERSGTVTITDWRRRHRWFVIPAELPVRLAVQDVYSSLNRLRRQALGARAALLHAAAIAIDGRGVLVLGAKGAGKTTLALDWLLAGRAAFVAADKVVAWEADGGARVVPVISSVRVQPSDARLFRHAPRSAALFEMASREATHPCHVVAGKLCVAPQPFVQAIGVGSLAAVQAVRLVFLEGADGPTVVAAIDAGEAAARLLEHLLDDPAGEAPVAPERPAPVLDALARTTVAVAVRGRAPLGDAGFRARVLG